MNVSLARILAVTLLLMGNLADAASPATVVPNEPVKVVMETQLGRIELAIDTLRAPRAAAYFLEHIDRGQYDGATLYRSASLDGLPEPQLVQGGLLAAALNTTRGVDLTTYGIGALLPAWETTRTSGYRHQRGSISLARDLLATGHVIPEIVFCLRDIPLMDAANDGKPDAKGYPVIGEVLSGMELIDAASRAELEGPTSIPFLEGQILSTPVKINRAFREGTISAKATNR